MSVVFRHRSRLSLSPRGGARRAREESSLASAREQVLSVRAAHDLGSRGPPLGADLDPEPLGAAELVRLVGLSSPTTVWSRSPDRWRPVGPVVAEVRGDAHLDLVAADEPVGRTLRRARLKSVAETAQTARARSARAKRVPSTTGGCRRHEAECHRNAGAVPAGRYFRGVGHGLESWIVRHV